MRRKTLKVAFRELRAEVDQLLGNQSLSLVERFNQGMPKVNDFLEMVRKEKTSEAFKDRFEEIYFFKFEKPEYYAQKIFLAGWFALMNGRPIGKLDLELYYQEELRYISRFFNRHAFHYHYYRSGMTELDELLFIRGTEVPAVFVAEVPELDPMFCTSGDYLFAKFMAYELLQEYIVGQLEALEIKVPLSVAAAPAKVMEWSGELINLVELGYGLYVSGQIGGGKVGLGEIFRWLEVSFGVEIGIPANRLREIKRRKRLDKLHFINLVQERLLAYIEDGDDLNYRGKA